jgi:excisionase family DNA binding protein
MSRGAPLASLGTVREAVPLEAHEQLATLLATLDGIAPDELPEILGLLEAAKARCWSRLTAPAPPPRTHDSGRMLSVREAATRLGLSVDYLYRHQRQLPFMQKVGTRTIRCPEAALTRWQATRRSCVNTY